MIKKIKLYIKAILQKIDCVENINLDLTHIQKKCLISYITTNFYYDLKQNSVPASNILEVNQIIKTFINLNYTIDVVGCMDINAFQKINKKQYDVIFGFGEVFNRMSKLYPTAKRIMYMTEHHPTFSKLKETERIVYFRRRHRKKVSIIRTGFYYQIENFDYIDDMILLGEKFPYNSEKYRIHEMNPTGLFNERYVFSKRDINHSKNNFLWFGSNGAIHKGLDLLIDIFSKRDDINLHICGLNKKDKKILNLPKSTNIIDYGRIDVESELFIELVNKCSFILLPSCSEGMSTSVLTCMRHSMIPIVMKDTGFNFLSDLVFLLEDYKLEYIEKTIDEIRKIDNSIIEKLHERIFLYANEEFNLESFTEKFNSIISNILK